MLEALVWLTAFLCAVGATRAYLKYRDLFHPAVIILPMFAFIYVVMPLHQIHAGDLFTFVPEDKLINYQTVILLGLCCLILGLEMGSKREPPPQNPNLIGYKPEVLHKGAYIIGAIGVLSWMYVVHNAGGFAAVFDRPKGMGWSDIGFIREAAYLMIVGVLLLISPEGYAPKNRMWLLALVVFSGPYLVQGLLGAQRGPTFLIIVSLGMSWYMARCERPSIATMAAGGALIGMLLLFLVANRGSIYIGSQREMKTDVTGVLDSDEANEYIFGAACMIAADQENHYYWGKRYLAQVLVRPIPKQIWPTKYQDFGVPELLLNAGVASVNLTTIMGWKQVPGAAAAMIADLWVEFWWLELPVLFGIGYAYGMVWRRAIELGGVWTTQYVIFVLLSIYMVTQSGEAVIFRFVILTLPTRYVWKKAEILAPA